MTGRRPLLEWALVGAAALWSILVPLIAAAGLRLAPSTLEGTWRQPALILAAGGLQIGGLLTAAALGKLVRGFDRLFLASLTLTVAAGWSAAAGAIRTALSADPQRAALLQLLIGLPFLLFLGGWLAGRTRGLLKGWAEMGLSRSGALGWGLAAAALALWPWGVFGALGDVHQSLSILFQSLVSGLLTEWLWRGLVLGLLLSITRRRWIAALMGGLLYLGFEMPVIVLEGGNDALLSLLAPFAALGLALLSTELWARSTKDSSGSGRPGVWAAVVFHTLYLAVPRLFVDPRLGEIELAHLAVRFYTPLVAGGVALLLFIRRMLPYRIARLPIGPRIRSLLTVALPWAAAAGAYLVLGAPGLANDGYLIILEEQADLAPCAGITGRDERLGVVHSLLLATASESQASIRAELDRMAVTYRPYYLVNMIRVDGTTRGMTGFASRPEVAAVIRNPNVRRYPNRWQLPRLDPITAVDKIPWGVDAMDAEQVWELGVTGKNITVAGHDTGYDWEHPELKGSYRGWDGHTAQHDTNWHDPWDGSQAPFDDNGHGTHTLGTVVGASVGVAPDARWIGCRNMRNGLGNPGSYVECLEFFLAPYPIGGDPFRDGDPTLAPHIVNNSWGCPAEEGCVAPEPLHTAVEVMRAAGIMMVVSAGNDGPNCSTIGAPADEDAVLTVGASTQEGEIIDFSSRGPAGEDLVKPDLVAPGVGILSSIPGGGFGAAAGTSMAGPHVAGLAALLWSADPSLIGDIDRTERLITETARPRTLAVACPAEDQPCACTPNGLLDQAPNNVYGHGVADALAAVRAALNLSEPGE